MNVASNDEFLAKPTWNPADVALDPRVGMTGLGTVAAYVGRKAAYTNMRSTFGYAMKDPQGVVRYYAADANGNPDTSREIPGAKSFRLLFNVGTVVAGSLLIGQARDANLDYLGLGAAAGGAANVLMTLVGID